MTGLRAALAGALAVGALAALAPAPADALATTSAPARAEAGEPFRADYSGQLRIWTVPAGVEHVSVTLVGGAGGNGGMTRYEDVAAAQSGGRGGPGGTVTAVLPVTPGQDLTYYVGGGGASAPDLTGYPAGATSGEMGGGAGGSGATTIFQTAATGGGGAGGSASWVKLGDTVLAVAGGGGGGGGAGQLRGTWISTKVYGGDGGAGGRAGIHGQGAVYRDGNTIVQRGPEGGRSEAHPGLVGGQGRDGVDRDGGGGGGGGGGYSSCGATVTGAGAPGPGGDFTQDVRAMMGGGGGGGGGSCAIASALDVRYSTADQQPSAPGSITFAVPQATTTSLSLSPEGGEQAVSPTFVAQVGPGVDAGTVAFRKVTRTGEETVLCEASPVGPNGRATCTPHQTHFLDLGDLGIDAVYSGTPTFRPSQSARWTYRVGRRTQIEVLSVGQPVKRYGLTPVKVRVWGGTTGGRVSFLGDERQGEQSRYLNSSGEATGELIFSRSGTQPLRIRYSGSNVSGDQSAATRLDTTVEVSEQIDGIEYAAFTFATTDRLDAATIPLGSTQRYSIRETAPREGNWFAHGTNVTVEMDHGTCRYGDDGVRPWWDCTPNAPGTHEVRIRAKQSTCTPLCYYTYFPEGRATLTAIGPLARISVTPQATQVQPGAPVRLMTQGFDAAGNALGRQTARYRISPQGTCFANACVSDHVGPVTITAEVDGPGGTTRTAETTVLLEAPSPNGAWHDSVAQLRDPGTLRVGVPFNFRGTLTSATPHVRSSASFFVDGEPTIECGPTPSVTDGNALVYPCFLSFASPGTHAVSMVFAGDATNRPTAVTRLVRVAGERAAIDLRHDGSTAKAGEPVSLAVDALDAGGLVLGEASNATLSVPDGVGSCAERTCTFTRPGTHTVTATAGALTDAVDVVVRPGDVARLAVSPGRVRVRAGEARTFTVEGFDRFDNSVGDLTSWATFALPEGSCDATGCRSDQVGEQTLTATVGELTGTAAFTVWEPAVERLVVTGPESLRAGEASTFTVLAYAADGELLGDRTGRATWTIDRQGTCEANRCTVTQLGYYQVTASYGGVSATLWLGAEPGPLSRLEIPLGAASNFAGDTIGYWAVGYDRFGNERGREPAVFSVTGGGTCDGGVCRVEKVGTHTVTARVGDVSSTVELTIIPARAARIAITPAVATTSTGEERRYVAEAFDAYGNSVGEVEAEYAISGGGSCVADRCSATKPGRYTVTATAWWPVYEYSLQATAELTVVPGELARIEVTPETATVAAGEPQAYAVEGFDRFGNPLGPRTATYAITGGSCDGATCSSNRAGTHTVTATVGSVEDTAQLTVTPAAVDRVELTPLTTTVGAGDGREFVMTGYDRHDNPLGELPAALSIAPADADAPEGGARCGARTCTADLPGRYVVTATHAGWTLTAELTVEIGPLVRVVLDRERAVVAAGRFATFMPTGYDRGGNSLGYARDVWLHVNGNPCLYANSCRIGAVGTYPVEARIGDSVVATAQMVVVPGPVSSMTLSPATATIRAGEAQAYAVTARDVFGNPIADPGASLAVDGGTCDDGGCTVTRAGSHTVTASVGEVQATAELTVEAGALAELVLSPATATITAGESQAYVVEGLDEFGNALGAQSAELAVTGGGSCADGACTVTRAGTHTVTATVGEVEATAELTVEAGALAELLLSPATATITAGEDQAYVVKGLDEFGNALGAQSAELAVRGGGSCEDGACTVTRAGTHTVTATVGEVEATAELTVEAGALAELVVSPATATITAGESQAYEVEGRDEFGNSLGAQTAELIVTGGGTCADGVCTVRRSGTHTVTASVGEIRATAALTVERASAPGGPGGGDPGTGEPGTDEPGPLTSLRITPASASITAGNSQEYAVEGFDDLGRSLGAQSATYTLSGGGSCAGAVCRASMAGSHTVTATVGDVTATATLEVLPAAPHQLVLDAPAARVRAGESMVVGVAIRDEFGNRVADVSGVRYAMSGAGICAGARCSSTRVGVHRVTATLGGLRASAEVEVVAAGLDRVTLTPRRTTVAVGTWQAYTPRGFDRFDNRVPARALTGARLTIRPAASRGGSATGARCEGLRCRTSAPGRYVVTLVVDGHTAAARLVVVRTRR